MQPQIDFEASNEEYRQDRSFLLPLKGAEGAAVEGEEEGAQPALEKNCALECLANILDFSNKLQVDVSTEKSLSRQNFQRAAVEWIWPLF